MSHGGHFLAGAYAIAALHNLANHGVQTGDAVFQMAPITEQNVSRFSAALSQEGWAGLDVHHLAESMRNGEHQFDPVRLLNLRDARQ
ncbi:MAG: hypothetical protein AAGA87_04010 [Pseudomonadota bacterium]